MATHDEDARPLLTNEDGGRPPAAQGDAGTTTSKVCARVEEGGAARAREVVCFSRVP
jgi:hypothetical protein